MGTAARGIIHNVERREAHDQVADWTEALPEWAWAVPRSSLVSQDDAHAHLFRWRKQVERWAEYRFQISRDGRLRED